MKGLSEPDQSKMPGDVKANKAEAAVQSKTEDVKEDDAQRIERLRNQIDGMEDRRSTRKQKTSAANGGTYKRRGEGR
jgi:hypothetical protein